MTEESSTDTLSASVLTDEVRKSVKNNIENIKKIINGRNVTLMAATKTVPCEIINYAIFECGLTDIGENRVQELLSKYDGLDLSKADLHFIGTLQPNKVKYIVDKVCLIHSLDSIKLAKEISKRSEQTGKITDVLCEVNIGEEDAKGGVPESEVRDFLNSVKQESALRIRGIMVIGPHCEDKNDYIPFFERTKNLYDKLRVDGYFADSPILSMGMSDNFDLAIEYGSNLIRPGTAIFGKRFYPQN